MIVSFFKAVEGVLETMLPNDTEMALRYKDCHLIVLRGFQDPRGYGPLWTARQVLKVLADLPPDVRFNFDGIDILCRAHLLTMREFDVMLAQVRVYLRSVSCGHFSKYDFNIKETVLSNCRKSI